MNRAARAQRRQRAARAGSRARRRVGATQISTITMPDERHRVEREDQRRAGQRHQHTRDRRADRPRAVDAHAAQRCGGRNLFGGNEIGLDRLPRRRGQRLPAADDEQQRQQHRRRGQPGAGQRGQQPHPRGHRPLRGDQQPAPVDQIGKHPRRQRQQHHRQRRRGLHQRHQHRGARIADEHPLRPDGLHPGAEVGDELRDPQRAVDRRAQRRPRRQWIGVDVPADVIRRSRIWPSRHCRRKRRHSEVLSGGSARIACERRCGAWCSNDIDDWPWPAITHRGR